jgi:bis(5'-nucleosidyl)-tetraphosphatase
MIKSRSAGGVVINTRGEVLVVNQKGISWSLPKGHIENGEDELQAAIREIYEESGVKDLELIRRLGSYTRYRIGKDGNDIKDELKEITLFLFKTNELELKPIDPENPLAVWVDKEKITELLTHQKDKEFFNSILKDL